MAILKRLIIIFLLFFLLVFPRTTYSESEDEVLRKIADLERQLSAARDRKTTLSGEITYMDNQIDLTRLRITETENKLGKIADDISSVSGKITTLEDALAFNSEVVVNRIITTYKNGQPDPIFLMLLADNFENFTQRLAYLRMVQRHDKVLLEQMSLTRKNYADQKNDLNVRKKQVETLKTQLNSYKVQLDSQKREKELLLIVTRNDESRYQQLLNDAVKELNALQSSQFTSKRNVKKGEVIGLMGSTGFSTGPHLHFGVYDLREDQANNFNYVSGVNDPLSLLKSRTLTVDSGACYDKLGSTSLGSGSWDWPMSNPHVSQCYGRTPYSFVYANGRHDGLDIYDAGDITVRSVDDGIAYFYRGNTGFGNNVRIFHSNGKMTLYLHLR